MTPTEKRRYIADFARQFGQPDKAIREQQGTDNKGPLLDKWIKPYASWSPGLPWCAAFVSAMAGITDERTSQQPARKYNSASSQCTGAGIYSNNPRDAQVGLAISWKNSDGSGGHAGLVIEVNSSGIVTAEGNTNNSAVQERNGGESAVKKYTWDKVSSPSPGRRFVGYMKIWPEENSTIGDPKNLPPSSGDTSIASNGVNSSGYINGASAPPGKSYDDFFKEINGNISTSGTIAELPEKEGKTNTGTEKSNDFSEVKTVSNPTTKLDTMSLNKEAESK